jgi:hypothetical protein
MTKIIQFPRGARWRSSPPTQPKYEPLPGSDEETAELLEAYQHELREMRRLRRRAEYLAGMALVASIISLVIRFIWMTICLLPLIFLLWLFFTVASHAGPIGQVVHNGSLMTMTQTPGGMVVRYAQPRPDLFGLVLPGTLLVEGRWVGPPPQMFVGTAFVFSSLCGPIPYPVRGTVDQSQALMLFGAAPQFDTACRILGYSIESQQAVLRFEPVK